MQHLDPFLGSTAYPTPHPLFSRVAIVLVFSPTIILELNMTLVRPSGSKSWRDPLVSQLLGVWVASSPLPKACWAEATELGYPALVRTRHMDAVKQYLPFSFPHQNLWGYSWSCMLPSWDTATSPPSSHGGGLPTRPTGHIFPRPIPTRQEFLDSWKDMVKLLELQAPVTMSEPPPPPLVAAVGPSSYAPVTFNRASGHGRLEPAPHVYCAWGCVPVR